MFNSNEIKKVDIIMVGDSIEALSIRSALESLFLQVRMHSIGNVKHLISLFSEENYLHELIIISCHGDKEGLFLPELAKELEATMPYSKRLKASDFEDFLKLNNQIVINTGCCLGNEEFAAAFLKNGALHYIGPQDYIEASAIGLFIITYAYFYFIKKISVNVAFEKAKNTDNETSHFNLWSPLEIG